MLQPNLQYIVHPGGHIPIPGGGSTVSGSPSAAIPDAWVFGLRTIVKF